jgi:hypothetical protein
MSLAALNTGGTPLMLVAGINDGTGETITVAAAATPQAILSATLYTATYNATGGLLTFTGSTGVVAVANSNALGAYEVLGIVGDGIATNSAVVDIELWASIGGAAKAQIGQGSRKTELASASRMAIPAAYAVWAPTAVGDTVEARVRVGTNGHALVIRDFSLIVRRIGQ